MALHYATGEEIKKGDHVLFHQEPGRIELVASELGDTEADWYVEEFGGGVMVLERVSGSTFIRADQLSNCEDLEFLSRDESPLNQS